jgi:hypothetical protein
MESAGNKEIQESVKSFSETQGEKYPESFVKRLKQTKWTNEEEVIDDLRIKWVLPPAVSNFSPSSQSSLP